jgi:hypothetical protein
MGTFYIIVLDKNDKGREPIWYVTASRSSLAQIKRITHQDDTIVMQLSKPLYQVDLVSEISLLNDHSGLDEPGKIYKVAHV